MATVDVFPVIAEPTRRRILDALRPGDRSVGELVEALGVSQPTVSKHLKVLREAGLVTTRADGQRRFYAVDPERFESAAAWLTSFLPSATVMPVVAAARDATGPGEPPVPEQRASTVPEPASGRPAPAAAVGVAPAVQPVPGQPAQHLGRTVGRTVEQVTGRAQDLLDRLPKPKFGRRR